MLQTFLATLNPMLMLFICIALGFTLKKCNLLPENAGKVIAKLELWAFCPALSFMSMSKNFTVSSLGTHFSNVIIASVSVAIALVIAILLSKLFVKDKVYERGVYQYALAFANSGYVGDPVVLALFGLEGLAYYKIICLPLSIVIYTWGLSVLVPHTEERKNPLKNLINPPMIAMLIGMIVGLTGLGKVIYSSDNFFTNTLNGLSSCMGPMAMILAGFTIGSYSVKKMLVNKKVYVATFLRLILIPAFIIAILFGLKELVNIIFGLNIDNIALFLLFFAIGAPLGLNTVVFPEAYGGDPSTGASMAMISHTLCVITIPLMYALLVAILGPAPIFI